MNNILFKRLFMPVMFALAFTGFCHAADGDLDTTYNTPTGSNTVSFGAADFAYGGVMQPDGKMIVVGGVRPGAVESWGVVRYNADGTLDTGFGTAGTYNLVFTAGQPARATGVVLQSDGKIIVTGYSRVVSGNYDFTAIRLTTAGVLDTTFGTSGITKVDFDTSNDQCQSSAIQPDGAIVMVGSSFTAGLVTQNSAIVRLTAAGALDTSFNSTGKLVVDIGDSQDVLSAVAIAPNGKIVAGGQPLIGATFYASLVQITSAGALDTTFDTDGILLFNQPGGNNDRTTRIVIQPDNKILFSGFSVSTTDAYVVRLTTTGALDTTFNTTGYSAVNYSTGSDQFLTLMLLPDGKIVAAGQYNSSGNPTDSVLAKFTSAGVLDSTFGTGGQLTRSFGANNDRITSIGVQSSGAIVVGGNTSAVVNVEDVFAARLLNTVSVSTTAPTVTTATPTTITHQGATLGGEVTSDGGASVTDRGIVWATTPSPTTANTKVQNGTGTGTFSAVVNGMAMNTLIYVRAYATNSVDTSYGNEVTFTTLGHPVLTSPTSTGVTASAATLGGTVTSAGGLTILERGVVFAPSTTNTGPTVGGFGCIHVSTTGTLGVFTVPVAGLTPGTQYHYSAYAQNSLGYGYTAPTTFTTVMPLTVTSLNRVNASPTNAGTVNWTLTFPSAITGVTASNFTLVGAAATGSIVGTPATSNNITWTIPVTTGSTDGLLTLRLANDTGLSASFGLPFDGQSYTIDKTAPTVQSVTRLTPLGQNTNATTVTFRVTYSEDVALNAPAASRFQVVPVNGSTIVGTVTGVTGTTNTRDVTVNLTSGVGEFKLRVLD